MSKVKHMRAELTQAQIRLIRSKYRNTNAGLGRAAGVTAGIVLKMITMQHGEEFSHEEFINASIKDRGLLQDIRNTVHREKLTAKQKILFDFMAKELDEEIPWRA